MALSLGTLQVVAAVAILATAVYLFVRRSLRPLELPDDGCLACGSTVRHAIAPGVYRCAACGYEGGPGVAALRDRQQLARHVVLDPAARTQAIFDDLSFARRQLLAAADRLDWLGAEWIELGEELIAGQLGLPDHPELPEVERPTLEAVERIAEAQRALADARTKARSGPTLLGAIEIPMRVWDDDHAAVALLRARRAHRAAHALLELVDDVLTRHFPGDTAGAEPAPDQPRPGA
jgi:hypothetical protein